MKKRPTFGLFLEGLADKYQAGILKGIREQVVKDDINLICFPGKHVKSENSFDYMANILYRIASESAIDGLIILSNTIFPFLNNSEIIEFIEPISGIPIISVGLQLPGIHDIIVESRQGIEELFSHLIDDHGYRKFIFIKGPDGHEEADFRFNTFQSILKNKSIPLPEKNVIQGNFQTGSGVPELLELLAGEKNGIDAVVAANDNMAIGAINALIESGYSLPEDIAVTGFDNTVESQYVTPPLTTVNQPLQELGKKCVVMLNKLFNKKNIPSKTRLQSRLIVRQSCGCFSRRVNQIFQLKTEPAKHLVRAGTAGIIQGIQNDLKSSFPYSHNQIEIKGRIKELVESLISDLSAKVFSNFIILLNDILQASFYSMSDIAFLNDVVLIIHKHLLINVNRKKLLKTESILEQAYVLISETASRQEAYKRIQEEQSYLKLQKINAELITEFDLLNSLKIIGRGIQGLNIPRFFIVLYDNKNTVPEWSRLHIGVVDGEIRIPGTEGIRFPTKEILPKAFLEEDKRFTYIVNALYLTNEQLGYIISEPGPDDPLVYLSLRDQISSAVIGVRMMAQIKNHTKYLEDQVAMRTIELKRVNERLLADIEKRKYLEKEIIEISSKEQQRIGQDLHDDLCQSIAGISVLASALGDRLKETQEKEAASAYQISDMMNETVSQTKKIVRGFYPTLLSDSLKSALKDLADRMEKMYCLPVVLEIEENISLSESVSIHLYRIAQEALSNALKHAKASSIWLSLKIIDGKTVLRIIDDGIGLPDQSTLFQGIGLNIMQYRANIINGNISIRHNGEKGTIVTCIVKEGK